MGLKKQEQTTENRAGWRGGNTSDDDGTRQLCRQERDDLIDEGDATECLNKEGSEGGTERYAAREKDK